MRPVLAACVLLVLLLLPASATADQPARLPRTIVDANRDNLLEYGPAEPYTVRSELAAKSGSGNAVRLIHFAQMTDTQLVDEESPIRVEFIDRLGGSFNAGYRTQEGLLPFVLNEE